MARRAATIALLFVTVFAYSQNTDDRYLARLERQTREESVCMLIQTDGQYHLERVSGERPRVYEGALPGSALDELKALVTSNQLLSIQPTQIETNLIADDLDQVSIAIVRPAGLQALNFPTAKSRKPFKATVDPILKWLDRNKQQQNPIAGAVTNRCMPPKDASATSQSANNVPKNFIVRMVADHFESRSLGGGLTAGQGAGNLEVNDFSNYKITRLCTVIYVNGRYRLEKSVRDFGAPQKTEVYRGTLDKPQLDSLGQVLSNPKLATLPNTGGAAAIAREGDQIMVFIPREKTLQSLSFTSAFGNRSQQIMKNSLRTDVSENIELIHPLRQWVKENVDDHKPAPEKEELPTNCLPATTPE